MTRLAINNVPPLTPNQRDGFRGALSIYYPAAEEAVAVICDGDSKGFESILGLFWASSRVPLQFEWTKNISQGGSVSNENAASPSGILSAARLSAMSTAIAEAKAAGFKSVDIFLTIGTNDGNTLTLTAEQTIANVKAYYDAFVAAGGRLLWVWGVDPAFTASGTTARGWAINAGYQDMARSLDQMVYVSSERYWLDPAATNYTPLGQSTNTPGSVTYDGLHGSVYGALQKGKAILPLAERAFRRRQHFDSLSSGGAFGASFPRGNILGAEGRFRALGGTVSATGGTVTGTPPLGWALTGTLNGLNVTFTAESSAAAAAALDLPADLPVVRCTFSGTPTANAVFILNRNFSNSGAVVPARFAHELLAYAEGLTGMTGIEHQSASMSLSPVTNNFVAAGLGSTASSVRNADALPAFTGLLHARVSVENTNTATNVQSNLRVMFRSGIAASGSLLLIGVCSRRAPFL